MFAKFDPQAYFENGGDEPAKAAKAPNIIETTTRTLADLGGLASRGSDFPEIHRPSKANDLATVNAVIAEHDDGLWSDEAEQIVALLDVPTEWIAGVNQLQFMTALRDWTKAEWRQLQTDANAFLAAWGAQAHRLGWTTLELFGCHSRAPRARYDAMGLVLILGSRSVMAMDEGMARIAIRKGVTHSHQRLLQSSEAVLIWGTPS